MINRYAANTETSSGVFVMNADEVLKKNATYRFRVLNSDFDQEYANIRFLYNCNPSIESSTCDELPFTVIGADSVLRKKPVKNVTTFRLSSAERIDLLIEFPNVADSYSVYVSEGSADGEEVFA